MLQTDYLNVLTGATINQITGTTNIDGESISLTSTNGDITINSDQDIHNVSGNILWNYASSGITSSTIGNFDMTGDQIHLTATNHNIILQTYNSGYTVNVGVGNNGSPVIGGLKLTSGCTFQLVTDGGTNRILTSDEKGYGKWVDYTGVITDGSSGTSGKNGSSGTSGSSGSSGSSGKNGSSGSSGSSGTSGSSGKNGSSGVSINYTSPTQYNIPMVNTTSPLSFMNSIMKGDIGTYKHIFIGNDPNSYIELRPDSNGINGAFINLYTTGTTDNSIENANESVTQNIIFNASTQTISLVPGGSGSKVSINSTIVLGSLNTQRISIIAGTGASAPSINAWTTPTIRYGGTTIMGTPTGWIDIQVNGVARKLPFYG